MPSARRPCGFPSTEGRSSRSCGCPFSSSLLFGGAKHAGGTDEEEEQQDREGSDILECRTEQHDGKRLTDAEQDAADQRPERPAEAADDRCDEAADRER